MPTTVTFGEVEATEVTYVSETELTVTLPAGAAAGAVDVAVATANGSDTLTDGFEYLDEPNLELTIPSTIAVTAGTAETYTTRLTNFGAEATEVTEEIRLTNAAGDLTVGDLEYGSMDVGGVWNRAEMVEDGGDLVATYTFAHTRAGLDSTSDVQILVMRPDTGDITGTSTYTNASGTLAQATYTFNVTVPDEGVMIFVPPDIEATVGEQTTYRTHLTNYGPEIPDTTEEIRLSNAAGDLVAADVTYETQDVGGVWNPVTWVEDGGDLVVTYDYANTAAGADHSSNVRITVARDTGDLTGHSSLSDAGGVLGAADYTIAVTAGGA